jgi:hypothetical protein
LLGWTRPVSYASTTAWGPIGQAELGQDVRDVGLDRGLGDEQRAGNRGIGLAAADEPQDLKLPRGTDTQATAYLLNEAGLFLYDQGQPSRAARYLQRAPADCVRVLGADHPDTLGSRNNLAAAHQAAGTWAGPSRCTSRPSPTSCACRAPSTPRPIS